MLVFHYNYEKFKNFILTGLQIYRIFTVLNDEYTLIKNNYQ